MTVVSVDRHHGAWRVRLREKRGAKWVTLSAAKFASEREANSEATKARRLVQQGKIQTRTDTPTVRSLIGDYAKHIGKRPTCRHIAPAMTHLANVLDEMIGELSAEWLQEVIDRVANAHGPHAAKRTLNVLRAAVRRGGFKKINPCDDVRAPRIGARRRRVLSNEEARALVKYVHKDFQDFYVLALYTGVRPSEEASWTAADIDLHGARVFIHRSVHGDTTKTGDERSVPLSPEALLVAKRLVKAGRWSDKIVRLASDEGMARVLHRAIHRAVDAGDCPGLSLGWELCCRRTGCGYREHSAKRVTEKRCPKCEYKLWAAARYHRVRWYDLRHTTATLLMESGVGAELIAQLHGHASEQFTREIYTHAQEKTLRKALTGISLAPRRKK
jgi:integrase